MIEKMNLEQLLDICKSADLDVSLDDGYIELRLEDEISATLMMNDDETRLSFCIIPNVDVSMDNEEDLELVNAINTAFFGNDDLPSFSACIDLYDEETDEDALMLRCAMSLDGGVSEARIINFIHDCINAIDVIVAIINGTDDSDETEE